MINFGTTKLRRNASRTLLIPDTHRTETKRDPAVRTACSSLLRSTFICSSLSPTWFSTVVLLRPRGRGAAAAAAAVADLFDEERVRRGSDRRVPVRGGFDDLAEVVRVFPQRVSAAPALLVRARLRAGWSPS